MCCNKEIITKKVVLTEEMKNKVSCETKKQQIIKKKTFPSLLFYIKACLYLFHFHEILHWMTVQHGFLTFLLYE